jgi:hypothetical protein
VRIKSTLNVTNQVLGWRMTHKTITQKVSVITLLILISTGLVTAAFAPFVIAQTNEVSGSISADTRWTKANSPYALNGPLFIDAGVSLLIDSGVTVNFNNHIIQVNGVMYASGSPSDPILFNSGKIVFSSTSGAWNEPTATGCLIQNAVFTSCKIEMQDSSPKIANNAFQRGSITIVGGNPHISGSASQILNNNIVGTTSLGSGISITGNNHVTISGNVIAGWSDGILAGNAQYSSDSHPKIERNLIVNNTHGIRIEICIRDTWGNNYPAIRENTIYKNFAGIRVACTWDKSGNPDEFLVPATISNNNIYDNSNNNVVGDCTLSINNNWWGTTNTQLISPTVSPRYMFSPFLTSSYASAPSQSYNPNPAFASAITFSSGDTSQPSNTQLQPSYIPQQENAQPNQKPAFPTTTVVAVALALIVVIVAVLAVWKIYGKSKTPEVNSTVSSPPSQPNI